MDLDSKIFVAGHLSIVGSSIRRRLEILGYSRLLLRTSDELDPTRQDAVEELFSWERPDYVFLAAPPNISDSIEGASSFADSLYTSLASEFNIINSAHQAGVKRLLFLGTSCVYPRWSQQVLAEATPLFTQVNGTNRTHLITKLAGVELCNAYNRQHGCRFLAVVPNNNGGRGHTYDMQHSDLIPAMIVKLHRAKLTGKPKVVLPGSGNLRRGFLFSNDFANACVSVMNLNDDDFAALSLNPSGPLINVECEQDVTTRELAQLIAEIVKFKGEVLFEGNDLESDPQDSLNTGRAETLRWHSQTTLREKVKETYRDFLSQTGTTEWELSGTVSLQTDQYATESKTGGH